MRRARWQRAFSSTAARSEIRDVALLPDRIMPKYHRMSCHLLFLVDLLKTLDSQTSDLLTLQWPSPPRNILMVKKNRAPAINESVIEYAKYGLLCGRLL
jgi:NADH kinase